MSDKNERDSQKLVWVVDDDETVLILAEDVLASEGFRARAFTDACRAWEAMAGNLPDIVVLDVLLPGMDGFEFCSKLRARPGGEDIPVLIMTSLDDPESISRAYEAGATDFAIKPVNWLIETRRLRYLLRAAEMARELKQKELETRLIKEDWERTFNSIRDIVTVLDQDLKIQRANSATAEALGKPLHEIIGVHCYNLFQGASEPCLGCPVVRTLKTGASASSEMVYRHPTGDRFISGSPVTDQQGRTLRVVHVARDLREQKQLEAEYRQAQKMEAVGTLAGGIAHEFNNLLQVILGFAEILATDTRAAGPPSSEIQAIIEAAQRGSGLTSQLLTFSRRGPGRSERRLLNVNLLVQDVHRMLERVLPKNVRIQTQLAPDLSWVNADPNQLQQVLMNLAVNAAQAMHEKGVLTIKTQNAKLGLDHGRSPREIRPGEYILLEVSDTGHGIDKKILDRIYEPFFTTRDIGEGTGLGLSVVFGIVKEHLGDIQCWSEPGRGTAFKIYLPAHPQKALRPSPGVEEKPAALRAVKTILVVDDEDGIRNLVRLYLTQAGYSVISAADGLSALKIYREQTERPAMVILDLGMPGMDGWECFEKLQGIDPEVKVLLATGYFGDDLTFRAQQRGAAGIVFKPYKMQDLTAKVCEALE